ncbi:MAG TPA: ABC transporter ATP-binding protein, partial [Armatimonadota bacterium]|nr:ABC transporter ATP-binding protein [Armatimonadota bacterium]
MIRVSNLRVDYDDVRAVDDLSLEIGAGEVYGLVGPNGAGKTSALRAFVGLVEPTYGEVLIDGIDIDEHRAEATRVIGFMPDSAPTYDDLTVWEFLDLFAASYMVPEATRAETTERSIEQVGLAEKRDTLTAGLSRGMKQRLMLAKTLLPDPRVLLLDEPASGLDPYGRALLKDIVRQQGADGKTVVISSHILSELSEFCTSIGIMERGKLVASGEVDTVATELFGDAEITLEVVSGAEAIVAIAAANPLAGEARVEGNRASFSFGGDEADASDLLAALIAGGARVSSFARKQRDLEA